MLNLIFKLNILVAVISLVTVSHTYAGSQVAFRGGEGGARGAYAHPNYSERAAVDRAYNRGYNQGTYQGAYEGGGFIDGAAPYVPETQGVTETPGYTDPYQSNDSIDPSYDID